MRAVVDGLTLPPEWPEIRAELDAEPDTAVLHRQLCELDPLAASRMEPGNRRRVLRALEVTIGSGRPFSSFGRPEGLGAHPPTRFRLAGVWLPRAVLRRRIAERLASQMERGFLEEVTRLVADPRGLSRTAGQALGYRELLGHLRGELPLEEALAQVVARTAEFARRQWMWFRRDPRITWLAAPANPLAALPALLRQWAS
ncbi:MAG: tRNA (adenosine(37)-N6)-dimethylallyltransferase [Acidimicrobiales bacterium]